MWRAPEGPEGLAAVPVGGGGAWPDNEPTHKHTSAHQVPLVWRAPEGSEGLAAVPVGGGGAWPDNEPTHKHTSAHQVPLVWRAPEGSEGLAAAPGTPAEPQATPSMRRAAAHGAARPHGRARRRPEHQRAISGQTGILPRGKWAVTRGGDGLVGNQCPEASKSNSAIEE